MKTVLIICAVGISSSLIAKKATGHFKDQGIEINVKATSVMAGMKAIASDEHDLYLISPQTRQYFDELSKSALKKNKIIELLPSQAYVANEKGTEILCAFIENLQQKNNF